MRKILLIDDEEVVRSFVRSALKYEDYIVEDVPDADSAFIALDEKHTDIVISDIFMPGKDGFEVIEEIKRGHPAVKIIAITGGGLNLFDAETALTTAKRSGADYALIKPFKRRELLGAIQAVLDLGESTQAI